MTPDEVPAGTLVVDSDVWSFLAFRKGRFEDFRPLVRGHLLAAAFATVGEILALRMINGAGDNRLAQIELALKGFVILPATEGVARQYAQLHAVLKQRAQGRFINDMWIAACALAQPTPLPVVTNNLRDFQEIAQVSGLVIVHPDIEASAA